MRLSAGDVANLPLACALFDRAGALVQATPEWPGSSLGALTYEAGVGKLVVIPDGCSPDVEGLARQLEPMLGACLREGNIAHFRYASEDVGRLAALQTQPGIRITALRWRQPNLNDVFMWVAEGKS